jgi:hypothetical protein
MEYLSRLQRILTEFAAKTRAFRVGKVLPRLAPFSADFSDIELSLPPRTPKLLAALHEIQKWKEFSDVLEFNGSLLFSRVETNEAEELFKKLYSAFPDGIDLGHAIGFQLIGPGLIDGRQDRQQRKSWYYWFQGAPPEERDCHNLSTYKYPTSAAYIQNAKALFERY